MMRPFCILFLLISTIRLGSAQDVKVSTSIDKTSYLIGDYIYLKIHAESDSSTKLFWPAPEEIADFELISANPIDTAREKSNFNFNQVIVYSVYDSGRYVIPAIRMQYKRAGDEQFNSTFSDSISFTVHTVAVDTTAAIKPVKGILNVVEKNYLWLYILLGVLALGVIGAAIYFLFFSKKSIKTILPKAKPKTLYESTMENLRNLDQRNLWQKGEIKKYYVELTGILRLYLELRFNMQALESTSDEIIMQMQSMQIPSGLTEEMTFILQTADMAKFAKSQPLPNENTLSMNYAIHFVEATKPVETQNQD